MPKLKTKKGVTKRFKLTKNGKVIHHSGGKSHLMSNKEPERLRKLRKQHTIEGRKEKAFIKSMLPYG